MDEENLKDVIVTTIYNILSVLVLEELSNYESHTRQQNKIGLENVYLNIQLPFLHSKRNAI